MNGYIYGGSVAVEQFDFLLHLSVDGCVDQSAELSDAVVGVYYEIAYL